MKVKLSGADRALLPSMFPVGSSEYVILALIEVEEMIKIKDEEHKKLGIVLNQDGAYPVDAKSNPKLLSEHEFEFSTVHIAALQESMAILNKEKMVTKPNIQTYLKIKNLKV